MCVTQVTGPPAAVADTDATPDALAAADGWCCCPPPVLGEYAGVSPMVEVAGDACGNGGAAVTVGTAGCDGGRDNAAASGSTADLKAPWEGTREKPPSAACWRRTGWLACERGYVEGGRSL